MSITAVGICGELLLDNKSVGAEKAPAVQVKNVEAQSVKTTAATEGKEDKTVGLAANLFGTST